MIAHSDKCAEGIQLRKDRVSNQWSGAIGYPQGKKGT